MCEVANYTVTWTECRARSLVMSSCVCIHCPQAFQTIPSSYNFQKISVPHLLQIILENHACINSTKPQLRGKERRGCTLVPVLRKSVRLFIFVYKIPIRAFYK
jgi:hypothetical protein